MPEAPASGVAAGYGNAAAQEELRARGLGSPAGPPANPGPLDGQMPEGLRLEDATVSFRLPAATRLAGDWSAELRTESATQVWITASRRELRISFWPEMLVDVVWPMSNVAWTGLSWDFARGDLGQVGVRNTQWAIGSAGAVREEIAKFARGVVAGTPLARPGYDPMQDPDLVATLAAVRASFERATAGPASGGRGVRTDQLDQIGLSAGVTATRDIEVGGAGGQLRLASGARLDLRVGLAGNAQALQDGQPPQVDHLDLSSTNLVLTSGGSEVARLLSVRVRRGGEVDVLEFEPLGKLREVGAGESLVRLLGWMVVLADRQIDPRVAANADLSARLTNGVAERQIEQGLTEAVRQLVNDHYDAIPGLDLRTVLGVERRRPTPDRS